MGEQDRPARPRREGSNRPERGRPERGRPERDGTERARPERGRSERGRSEQGRSEQGAEHGPPERGRSDHGRADRGRADRVRPEGRGAGPAGPPERRSRPDEAPRPGLARKADEPAVPEGVDIRELHRAVRAELRSLPKDLAEVVASHLLLAGRLIDDDPALAHRHAEAARRRAARLPIVREAAAETAYAAGLYDVALSEFRALRRMTGTHDYLPVMADCERALGRPQNAIKLARESDRYELEPALRVEMVIVEAGARHDVGQDPEARRILDRALKQLSGADPGLRLPRARLSYALADALMSAGQEAEARELFAAAARLDTDQETDAQQRLDQLDGMQIDFDEDEDEDGDAEPDRPPSPPPGRRTDRPTRRPSGPAGRGRG